MTSDTDISKLFSPRNLPLQLPTPEFYLHPILTIARMCDYDVMFCSLHINKPDIKANC